MLILEKYGDEKNKKIQNVKKKKKRTPKLGKRKMKKQWIHQNE